MSLECAFFHRGEREVKTKWIEIEAKENPPKPLVMEIMVSCSRCGGTVERTYPTREQVEKQFKDKAMADGDTERCWCVCDLRVNEECACPCHFKGGC